MPVEGLLAHRNRYSDCSMLLDARSIVELLCYILVGVFEPVLAVCIEGRNILIACFRIQVD